MPENSNRNMFAFMILAVLILIGYEFFVLQPQAKRERAAAAEQAKLAPAGAVPGTAPGAAAAPVRITRDQAVAGTPRVAIETPTLSGSISLKGARFDDLYLRRYKETLGKPETVEWLRPDGVEHAQFAEFGWTGPNVPGLPTRDTVWTLASGERLTPQSPVVLTYDNGAGLRFSRTISVDDKYVFTVADTVVNASTLPIQIAPYGSVQRQGLPDLIGRNQIVHEGGVGALGTDKYELKLTKKFPGWKKSGQDLSFASTGGWLGMTDKYWMTALIPDQKTPLQAQFRSTLTAGVDVFDASYVGQARNIAPGFQTVSTTRLFAGAKTVPLLKEYQKTLGAPRFEDSVDWGMFYFFTKPLFAFLELIYRQIGNFGLAILALTVVVKLVFFPLANKSYESITKMKKVQPLMEELKKKYPNDPAKLQQEMMGIYQREKINPLSGCLPLLIQIPVFYSLFKVLTVTIEMRHAPFFGWINDLSARDPLTVVNLFGLLPFDPAMVPMIGSILNGPLHLSALAIIYGLSMWLSQAMNPPPPDPTQKMIFQLLPIILTFTLAGVASGLLIYWIWSNVLTIAQQYFIMRRFKVDNPIDDIIGRLTGKPKATS